MLSYGKCMGFPINFPQYKCNRTHGMGKVQETDTHTFPIVWVLFSHPMVYFSIWEMHGFSHRFPTVWDNAIKPIVWGSLGHRYSYFSHSMGAFFSSGSHPMIYFSIWEMHGFPHKFPTIRENATKPMAWGKSGKLIPTLFPQYGCFFSIRFLFYGILHHMGDVWVSPSISHSTGKCNKTLRMDELKNWYSHFSHSMGNFSPYNFHPTVYFII